LTNSTGARCPTLPPKPAYIGSFKQQIAEKVHNDLVLRTKPPPIMATACPLTERSTFTTLAPSLRVKVSSALAKTDIGLSLPSELVDNNVIIKGKQHKRQILQEYEANFGADYPKSIIAKRKGKHSHEPDFVHPTRMSPSIKKYYRVQELSLYNVITTVIKEYRASFTSTDLQNLSSINRGFSRMIPNTIRWLRLDFSPLRKPQYNYESQIGRASCRERVCCKV
jgi:hypothetical protein